MLNIHNRINVQSEFADTAAFLNSPGMIEAAGEHAFAARAFVSEVCDMLGLARPCACDLRAARAIVNRSSIADALAALPMSGGRNAAVLARRLAYALSQTTPRRPVRPAGNVVAFASAA